MGLSRHCPVCSPTWGLPFADRSRAWVACNASDHGVTVSPDGRYAFVSVEGVGAEPGKVDVFDLETLERVADVEVGQQASGIDFWRMEPR